MRRARVDVQRMLCELDVELSKARHERLDADPSVRDYLTRRLDDLLDARLHVMQLRVVSDT